MFQKDVGQNIGDLLILQVLFRCQEQLGKRQRGFLIQLKLSICMGILAAFYSRTAERVIRVMLVKPIIFVQNGYTGSLNGRNITEGIPHDLEMIVHLTAASHKEALGNILTAVAAAAGKLQLLKEMDVLPLHLSVTDAMERAAVRSGQTGTDDIERIFYLHLPAFPDEQRIHKFQLNNT